MKTITFVVFALILAQYTLHQEQQMSKIDYTKYQFVHK